VKRNVDINNFIVFLSFYEADDNNAKLPFFLLTHREYLYVMKKLAIWFCLFKNYTLESKNGGDAQPEDAHSVNLKIITWHYDVVVIGLTRLKGTNERMENDQLIYERAQPQFPDECRKKSTFSLVHVKRPFNKNNIFLLYYKHVHFITL
jgi:hypothetical protein